MTDLVRTGGCQCGAVRFQVEGPLGDASVCHCRMCQKASGNFYLPLVSVRQARLTWTREVPKRFQSSNHVRRAFCPHCGTPLTYEAPDGMSVTIAAFDEPADIRPTVQWGTENKLPYVDGVADLPAHATLEDLTAASFIADIVSYQHPDHQVPGWTPRLDEEERETKDHWRPQEQGV
ncbi:aldehyde-activating protein [Rhizobium rhizosphaerae]|uniref:Aldehyde-activating protein n=1 Tax=Xaviernesmea rhizosphaerae TaxID=1672749 RepID=A0ABX3PB23_9HYPH|nr:GFA family protein [Xaviernesmea rhizosphaerae]OQP85664.1 aldehyde-activating protein [Xaviernesmea rhizosphaerae]